ncbi:MAG TPA: AsmA-like C-terminal region-containing protein, partial [Xanthomonadales bacterium]|nr:AsmA-like C-terminal region-containing protein [Xanthomonadales bacterium]
APARKHLVLRSDLRGTAIALPAPLRKDADSTLPVRIALDLPVADSPLRVELGRLLRADAHLPGTKPFAAALGFGLAEPPQMPANGLRIRGDVAALDLAGWSAIGGVDGGGGGFLDLELDAGVLDMFSREFPDTQVSIAPEDGGTRLRAKGPLIDGRVLLPADRAAAGVTAEFEKLHFPEARPGDASKPFDPGAMPPLHLWVKDLRFGKAQLGDARVETFPSAGGMHVERLETRTPNLEIRARGDWATTEGRERSRFDATFTAEDLGRMLDTLGFAGMFEGGQTVATLRGEWPGSPAQFGLSTTDGTLEISVGKGRIPDVEPGMGRVFGLISFQALPRRLSLDFSDFFGEGLAFDRITGTFELRGGNAYTKDTVLKGPSVEIKVTGRTGLAAKDYDQVLDVTPKVGGVLPVVGALAAGPAGVAAGLVVQNVLSSPLKQIARARYTVKGGWDKPEIELVEKQHPQRKRPQRG